MAPVSYIKLVGLFAIIAAVIATHQASSKPTCCPTFWTQFNGDCYRYMARPEAWEEAERKCQQLGSAIDGMQGHLVSVHSEDENSFVVNYANDLFVPPAAPPEFKLRDQAIWLGFQTRSQGRSYKSDQTQWNDGTAATAWNYRWWKKWRCGTSYGRETFLCGHLMNARSKMKGRWSVNYCSKKLPFVCKLSLIVSVPSNAQELSLMPDTDAGQLPCSYRGTPILHGNQLRLDRCTVCSCDNSTIKYDTKSCAPTFCNESVVIGLDECCDICPYYVAIYEVTPVEFRSLTVGAMRIVIMDLRIQFHENGQGEQGTGLWKVSAWASANENGTGKRVGYQNQVLSDEMSSTEIYRPSILSGFNYKFRGIDVTLDTSDSSPEEINYLCVLFNKGDNPQPVYDERVPFTVLGVESETDTTPNSNNLLGCHAFDNV